MLIGKTNETENNEDEYAIESEEDLKQRIIEYEKYKNITKELKALEAFSYTHLAKRKQNFHIMISSIANKIKFYN